MIVYEPAHRQDLPAIGALFQQAFPEALTAVFDRAPIPARPLEDVLTSAFEVEPQGFIVARESGKLIGVTIGVGDIDRLYRHIALESFWIWLWRWMSGGYRGLGVSFIPRVLRLAWDYRDAETPAVAVEKPLAQILTLIVVPGRQGEGIGGALMKALLEYLAQTPARTLRLEVDAAKPNAVHLYEKFGFRERARMPTPRGPALIMMRAARSA